MQLHDIKPAHKAKRGYRVGRGGKRGTYSGRGIKGQRARAGSKIRPAVRDILKKIPKLRGYKFKSFRQQPAVLNLSVLNARFKEGDEVSPKSLFEKRLVRKIKGALPKVKILGTGDLQKKLIFKDIAFSKSAAAKWKRI